MPYSPKEAENYRIPRASLSTVPSRKRIIGIDLATTECCIAISSVVSDGLEPVGKSQTRPPFVFEGWPAGKIGSEGSQWRPITALYFDSPDRLPITGNDLIPMLSIKGRINKPRFNIDRFFRLWKLMFHDPQNDATITALQADIQRKLDLMGKTVDDLIRGWVAEVYATLFAEIDGGLVRLDTGSMDFTGLEIVVTVPPGRSVMAHDQVARAFAQGPIRADQISLVSEPEAMFRSWVDNGIDTQHCKVGHNYIVCDGGGGTCNFVKYRLDNLSPLSFTQDSESESIICGGETISNAFEVLAATMVPEDISNRSWVLDFLRRQFDEAYKTTFGRALFEDLEYCFDKPWDRNDVLVFSHQQIASCFSDCISRLNGGIRHQLQQGHHSGQATKSFVNPMTVDCLVLGGGLFRSPYVLEKIKEEFPFLQICELWKQADDKKHVAIGAVLSRLHAKNDFLKKRPILQSIAIFTKLQVTPAIKRLKIWSQLDIKTEPNRRRYFWAAQWLVKQGDDSGEAGSNGFSEVSSESSVDTARIRIFPLDAQSLEFSETILTVNCHPGSAEWTALRKGDDRLITPEGNLLPGYTPEEVTWNPQEFGVPIQNLEVVSPKNKDAYRRLRYSIQMRMTEFGTDYRIKAYFWNNCEEKRFISLISKATNRQAVFQSQNISQILSRSRELGSGTRFEGDENNLIPSEHRANMYQQFRSTAPLPESTLQTMLQESRPISNLPIGTDAPQMVPACSENDFRPNLIALSAPSTTAIPQKRSIPEDARQRPTKALRRPSVARPTKGQSTDSGGKYKLGARRNNGGCWTCAFRGIKCQQGRPVCVQCSGVGVMCEYGRPIWFYDEKMKEQQRSLNKRLMKDKARILSQERQSSAYISKSSTPRKQATARSVPLISVELQTRQVQQASSSEFDAQRSKIFQPQMSIPSELERSTKVSSRILGEKPGMPRQPESVDLYAASPPPTQKFKLQSQSLSRSSTVGSARLRNSAAASHPNLWNQLDEEKLGLQYDSDSPDAESDEDYVLEKDN